MRKHDLRDQVMCDADHIELVERHVQRENRYRGVFLLAGSALLLVVAAVALLMTGRQHSASTAVPAPVLVCYYNTPGAPPALQPAALHPRLCTHINVAFARVQDKAIALDPTQIDAIHAIVQLKKENPALKILLSVGGAGNDNGFSEMVADHASRKIFIRSIKSTLRNYTLDGIDLDWEFPVVHNYNNPKGSRERQHFSQLLREIRAEYIREKRDYMLTVAVAAPEPIANVAYDVDQLNMYADFVNLMTYDFHAYSRVTPFTGFNAPLNPGVDEHLYFATLNINYTVHMYLQRGLQRDKLVVGIPTYGHTFTLVNVDNAVPGAPAAGVGALGARGFADYPAICAFLAGARVDRDAAAAAPYAVHGDEWVSYEDPLSVMSKAAFIREKGLRGAMIYSLNADDYRGACAGPNTRLPVTFPLATSIKRALLSSKTLQSGQHSDAQD